MSGQFLCTVLTAQDYDLPTALRDLAAQLEQVDRDSILAVTVRDGEDGMCEERTWQILAFVNDEPTRRCRVCGCTDAHGCEDGCYWVEADLCSQCVGKADAQAPAPEQPR
jgi:hypothetical protein